MSRYYTKHTEFLSHEPTRRDPWRGYKGRAGVRKTVAYFRSNGGTNALRFFVPSVNMLGLTTYAEIPREKWDEYFAD